MLRLCALLLAPLGAAAAAGDWQWTVLHGGSSQDLLHAVQVDPSGNIIGVGWTGSSLDGYTNAGISDALLISFASTGAWQWTVLRGGSSDEDFRAVQVHPNGKLIAAGYTDSSLDGYTNAGRWDVLLMSFNSTAWQWTMQRGGAETELFNDLQVDMSGNIIAAGSTGSSLDGHTNPNTFADALLMSFDSNGAWQWTVQRGGSDDDVFHAVQVHLQQQFPARSSSSCSGRASRSLYKSPDHPQGPQKKSQQLSKWRGVGGTAEIGLSGSRCKISATWRWNTCTTSQNTRTPSAKAAEGSICQEPPPPEEPPAFQQDERRMLLESLRPAITGGF